MRAVGERREQAARRGDEPSLVDVAAASTHRAPLLAAVLVGVVLTAAVVAFLVQNTDVVRFEWFWLELEAPEWLAVVWGAAIGALLALVAAGSLRHSRAVRRDRRRAVADARG
jgi:uncharacterized integral membrane protein